MTYELYNEHMKSFFYHIQLNVDFAHIGFYKELMTFLGWSVIFEEHNVVGYKSGINGDLWFIKNDSRKQSDRDGIGMNHISIRVDEMKDVDAVVNFLQEKSVTRLFETPRHRPEFSSEGKTYYQVMFESPDKILFEVVFIGPKSS